MCSSKWYNLYILQSVWRQTKLWFILGCVILRLSKSILIHNIEYYKSQFTCTIKQQFNAIVQNLNHLVPAYHNSPKTNINTIEKYRLNRWYRILLTSRNCILIYNPLCCCLHSNRCIFQIFHRLSNKCIYFIAFIYIGYSSTIYIPILNWFLGHKTQIQHMRLSTGTTKNSLISSRNIFWFYVWRALHDNMKKALSPHFISIFQF